MLNDADFFANLILKSNTAFAKLRDKDNVIDTPVNVPVNILTNGLVDTQDIKGLFVRNVFFSYDAIHNTDKSLVCACGFEYFEKDTPPWYYPHFFEAMKRCPKCKEEGYVIAKSELKYNYDACVESSVFCYSSVNEGQSYA